MSQSECSQFLAELASDYDRSRRFLAKLEESLRANVTDPPCEPQPRQDLGHPDTNAEGQAPSSNARGVSALRKLARLFARKPSSLTRRQQPSAGAEDSEVAVAPRCPSVVSLSFETGIESPQQEQQRRASSHAPSPSRSRRSSMELRQQQVRPEGLEQRHATEGTLGVQTAAVRRNSVEHSGFTGGRSVSLETALAGSPFKPASQVSSPMSTSALSTGQSSAFPELPARSLSQKQQHLPPPQQQMLPRRASSGVNTMLPRSSFGPATPWAPTEDTVLPGHEAVPRHASFTRRRSVEACASPFTYSQVPQPPGVVSQTGPRPPVGPPLPARALSYRASGGAAGSVTGMRVLSLANAATSSLMDDDEGGIAASGAASSTMRRGDVLMSCGSGEVAGVVSVASMASGAMSRLSTTSLSLHAAAGAGLTDSPSGSSAQQPALPVTPMRTRSLRYMASAVGGSRPLGVQTATGMASMPAGSAMGGASQVRHHSFRMPRIGGDGMPELGATGVRRLDNARAVDGKDGAAEGGFRGTMHLI